MALACCIVGPTALSAAEPVMPTWDDVEQIVQSYFKSKPDYDLGNLIDRGDVDNVLKLIAEAGWEVPGARELSKRSLPDNHFLVREFSKPAGRKFMRQIAALPGAYRELDRLSAISKGEPLVRHLIKTPGGYEFIEYLTTTKQGDNLGRAAKAVKRGSDLNEPTGRIYTEADLVRALARRYPKETSQSATP